LEVICDADAFRRSCSTVLKGLRSRESVAGIRACNMSRRTGTNAYTAVPSSPYSVMIASPFVSRSAVNNRMFFRGFPA